MDDKTICQQYINLNYDYLMLMSNPAVKRIAYSQKKYGKIYKIKKCFEIYHYLGFEIFIHFLFQKKALKEIPKMTNYNFCEGISPKIAVYTAIFGKSDEIKEPLYKPDNIDYYIITDQEVPVNSLWKKVEYNNIFFEDFSNIYKNRYCKLFPNEFFNDYDYSIYVDGNILILADISNLLNEIEDKSIGIFSHPYRDDIYSEAAAVVYLNNAKPKDVKTQIRAYKKDGFPPKYGLFENSLIVRAHNNFECIQVMKAWWNQLTTYTSRDQLSLMYVLWKMGYGKDFVKSLGSDIDLYPLIRRVQHADK